MIRDESCFVIETSEFPFMFFVMELGVKSGVISDCLLPGKEEGDLVVK